jgi:RNA polymerase sigma factor (sigma-70 family)
MNMQDILENEELTKLLNSSISKTYYKYKLSFIIDMEDFIQEVNLYIIKNIKNFDNEKSSLKTYLPMLVMSCARICIQTANGQSKKHNKLEFNNNNNISLDDEFKNSENDNMNYSELIGTDENIHINLLIQEILNISSLSKNQRLIVELLSKGYTITDIAIKLNKTPSCINITFQRAKEKIVRKYAL